MFRMKSQFLVLFLVAPPLTGCATHANDSDYQAFTRKQQALDACASANYIIAAQWGVVELLNKNEFTDRYGSLNVECTT